MQKQNDKIRLNRRLKVLTYALGALVVFIFSLVWLIQAMTGGQATRNWDAVEAEIISNASTKSFSGETTSVETRVIYTVKGVEYEAVLDDFLIKGKGTVYVNPSDPTQVVGEQGPQVQRYGRPLIATLGSGLFLIVLGLIALSPKED